MPDLASASLSALRGFVIPAASPAAPGDAKTRTSTGSTPRSTTSAPSAGGEARPGAARLALRVLAIAALSCAYLLPALAAAAGLAVARGRAAAERHLARRGVALLERLGPAFVKGGQILGTRRDVLPAAVCDALSALHDAVAPPPPERARAALRAVYGPALDAVFAEVEPFPAASGSVACVHRARLADGRVVAVKLQRPEAPARMAADLALAEGLGGLAARVPALRGTPVREVLAHLCAAVRGQLDFEREAESLRRLRENLSVVPRVWVPRLEAGASRPRAVVMEWIPGLDPETARRAAPAARRRYAASTLAAVYHMLFVDGFVHCDLHPGNLYFTASGQVVVLDAGFSVRLSERMRRLFAEFFLNMALGRGRRCAEIVVQSADRVRPGADVEAFTGRMADLVHRSAGLSARDFSLIAFAAEMFELQRRFGLHASTELVFPLLSLLVIEGTVRELDPDVDFQAAARPLLTQGVFGARPAAAEA